jgi:hypothetical protein
MAARLGDYLGFRKAQIQKAQEAIEKKNKREEDYSIEKCIDIVDAMEGLSDDEKADANEVFQNETQESVCWYQKSKCQADLVEEKNCSAFYPLQCCQQ